MCVASGKQSSSLKATLYPIDKKHMQETGMNKSFMEKVYHSPLSLSLFFFSFS